jgi:glycosyltransferase involved in cell wall biosynthesis
MARSAAGGRILNGGRMEDPGRGTIAFLPAMDRFEDFYDTLDISLEAFRDRINGGHMFNYVQALRSAGIQTVLFFGSAHLSEPLRFRHRPTGTPVCLLPSPRLHQKLQGARDRYLPGSKVMRSVLSYGSIPPRLLAQELRRDRCQAILCQEYEHARFDVCSLLGRLLRLPVFATFQGGTAGASRLERPIRPLALRWCSGLIVGAGGELARVQSQYALPSAKLAYIPNPVDVQAKPPLDRHQAREQLGIDPNALVVVWHGRVQIELKGLDTLLDSWRLVRDARAGVPLLLLLVGGGNEAEELRRLLQGSGLDNVRWVDRFIVDRDELSQYLAAADISTLPSRREGFPVAALEAMACGLPVVAAQVNGIAEMLEGGEASGGIVVPPGDTRALAGALGRVLDDERLRQELGSRARRRVEQRFSLEVVGGQLREFMVGRGAFRATC